MFFVTVFLVGIRVGCDQVKAAVALRKNAKIECERIVVVMQLGCFLLLADVGSRHNSGPSQARVKNSHALLVPYKFESLFLRQ